MITRFVQQVWEVIAAAVLWLFDPAPALVVYEHRCGYCRSAFTRYPDDRFCPQCGAPVDEKDLTL